MRCHIHFWQQLVIKLGLVVEADKFSVATDAIKKAKELGVKLMLPIEHIVTSNFDKEKMVVCNVRTADLDIPDGEVLSI